MHTLVLNAFVGPCPEGMECRHFPDRDRHNNRLVNLSWGTHLENEADKEAHGTRLVGERAADAIYSDADMSRALRDLDAGVPREVVAASIGASRDYIAQVDRGLARRNLSCVGRSPRPACRARGERASSAVLTEEIVRSLRVEPPHVTNKELAARHGVDPSSISNARRYKSWKHVA